MVPSEESVHDDDSVVAPASQALDAAAPRPFKAEKKRGEPRRYGDKQTDSDRKVEDLFDSLKKITNIRKDLSAAVDGCDDSDSRNAKDAAALNDRVSVIADDLRAAIGNRLVVRLNDELLDLEDTLDNPIGPVDHDRSMEIVLYSRKAVPWKFARLAGFGVMKVGFIVTACIVHLPIALSVGAFVACGAGMKYEAERLGIVGPGVCTAIDDSVNRVRGVIDLRTDGGDRVNPVQPINNDLATFRRIGTLKTLRTPIVCEDDIMLSLGYKSCALRQVHVEAFDHLVQLKAGAKRTEINLDNMFAELTKSFAGRMSTIMASDTAEYAHQHLSALKAKRDRANVFSCSAPARSDGKGWGSGS